MSKLLKLKSWITLPEAVKHLQPLIGEDLFEADLLRLALDGHLRLSVRFVNGARAKAGKLVPIEEAEYEEYPALDGDGTVRMYKGPTLYSKGVESYVVELEETFFPLDGVYDLPMFGSERHLVEEEYQMRTGGHPVTLVGLEGAFVEGANKVIFQLHEKSESGDYYPCRLPEDCMLVVRTESLRMFEKKLMEDTTLASADEPLSTKERNTLLCIIATLGTMAKVEYERPAKAAGVIQREAAGIGISIGETTIENHLKRIPEALASRTK